MISKSGHKWRFWSDTNQRDFEDFLDQIGVPYEVLDLYVVAVEVEAPQVNDMAEQLGGTEV